jgi:transcriptional regulator with XRE-family HTH domain
MHHTERQRQEISQQRLSELSRLSRTGVSHIEGLEKNPTLVSLLKIAKALKIDLNVLTNDSQL